MYTLANEMEQGREGVFALCDKAGRPSESSERPWQGTDRDERYTRIGRSVLQVALITILLLVIGCNVGPKYVRPSVQSAPAYKELPQADANGSDTFRTAQPRDGTTRGKWWEAFNDP